LTIFNNYGRPTATILFNDLNFNPAVKRSKQYIIIIDFFTTFNKDKKKAYQTVGTIPKFNRKIEKNRQIRYP